MPPAPTTSLGALVLAAGASQRMGRAKLLLPWGTTTVVGAVLASLRAAGAAPVLVVHAPDDRALLAELDRLAVPSAHRVVNPRRDDGMFSSVRVGLAWPGWPDEVTQVAIALGDQPGIHPRTLRALFAAAAEAPHEVWQPRFDGRNGHPIVVPRSLIARLLASDQPHLQAALLAARATVRSHEVTDHGIAWDLDTSDEYDYRFHQAHGRIHSPGR